MYKRQGFALLAIYFFKEDGGLTQMEVTRTDFETILPHLCLLYTSAYFVNASDADIMGHKEGKANNLRAMRFSEVLLMYAEACEMCIRDSI